MTTEHKPHSTQEIRVHAEWLMSDQNAYGVSADEELLCQMALGLVEQLETLREALEEVMPESHHPTCASFWEPPSRPMECDCGYALAEAALAASSGERVRAGMLSPTSSTEGASQSPEESSPASESEKQPCQRCGNRQWTYLAGNPAYPRRGFAYCSTCDPARETSNQERDPASEPESA